MCGRRQRVRIEDNYSSWCELNAGVPQGGVLIPLLFAVFITSISDHVNSSYHLYADDLRIYTQLPVATLNLAVSRINSDLEHMLQWGRFYRLNENPDKTQVIIFSSRMLN